MIVKSPERMTCDEQGTWWFQRTASVRGRCHIHVCESCGETVANYPSHKSARFCSKACAAPITHRSNVAPFQGSGPLHYGWKGGEITTKRGYVMAWNPEHPACQGNTRKYVPKHRLVMEEVLGRLLTKTERVHHKDGNRSNNDPSNLELWDVGHPSGQRVNEKTVEIPLSVLIELLSRYS